MASTLLSFVSRNSDTLAGTYEELFAERIADLLYRCAQHFYGITPDNLDDPVFAMHRRLQPFQPILLRASLTSEQKYAAIYELAELLPLIFYTDLLFTTLDQHIVTDHYPRTIKLAVIEHLFQLNIPFSRIEVYDQLINYFNNGQPTIRTINTLFTLKESAPDNLFALDVCECAISSLMLEAHDSLDYDDYDNVYTRASAMLRVVLAHNYGLPLEYENELSTIVKNPAVNSLKETALNCLYKYQPFRRTLLPHLSNQLQLDVQLPPASTSPYSTITLDLQDIYGMLLYGNKVPPTMHIELQLLPDDLIFADETNINLSRVR